MTDLEVFQKEHGAQWALITQGPAFAAAMTLLNAEKIQALAELTDEEIQIKGAIILADLRGHLKHENALLGLHQTKKLVFQNLGEEEYPDPIREAEEQAVGGDEGHEDEPGEKIQFVPPPPPPPGPTKKKKLPAEKKARKIRGKNKR